MLVPAERFPSRENHVRPLPPSSFPETTSSTCTTWRSQRCRWSCQPGTTARRRRNSPPVGSMRRGTAPSPGYVGDWCPSGRRTLRLAPASSTRGRRPFMKSWPTGRPFGRAAAWCRQVAGSSGKAPAGAKQPWYIAPADGSPLSFAALWERWDRSGDGLETCTIITTEACEGLADIHHR